MIFLSDEEVDKIAWREVLTGAESSAEDWIDEDGEFSYEDGDRIFERQMEIIRTLRESVRVLFDG